jgi:serine/threonine protein kinase
VGLVHIHGWLLKSLNRLNFQRRATYGGNQSINSHHSLNKQKQQFNTRLIKQFNVFVCSFGVVLWEILTGEKPYKGLNMFVVAYGVGHGTLTLPIPEDCPISLKQLMRSCWIREHGSRPSFPNIKEILISLQDSEFSLTSDEDFKLMQSIWKEEVHKRFEELKTVETELETKEQNLMQRMAIQEQRVEEVKKQLQEHNLVEIIDKVVHEHLKELAVERDVS